MILGAPRDSSDGLALLAAQAELRALLGGAGPSQGSGEGEEEEEEQEHAEAAEEG